MFRKKPVKEACGADANTVVYNALTYLIANQEEYQDQYPDSLCEDCWELAGRLRQRAWDVMGRQSIRIDIELTEPR